MPKKWPTENSKSAVAKARKAAVKDEADAKKQKEAEDAYWQEDDKNVQKKLQRKEERDKKKTEQLEKKAEIQRLLDEETAKLAGKSAKPEKQEKLTRADIQRYQEQVEREEDAKRNQQTHVERPLEGNVNRAVVEGKVARGIDEAIAVLTVTPEDPEKHPEKRMKSAYVKFEETTLPRLKEENPNLRLSQLKQLLKKEWTKSPDNPFNQAHAAYNSKKGAIEEEDDDDDDE